MQPNTYPVIFSVDYPDRALKVKWLLAIPHYIVLFLLQIGAFVAIIIAWFAILFTGNYPQGISTFIEGVLRWHNRVIAYAFILTTDAYPPFTLAP